MNAQDRTRSRKVIDEHYDLAAGHYEAFLDPYMQYTNARFEGTDDLNEAQVIKMRNICEKLRLKPGDRVLDIGGGWGGLARFMVAEYGALPTIVTLSHEQAEYVRKNCGDFVKVLECDYRDIPDNYRERFNALSAVGVLEHIGSKNYGQFSRIAHQFLKSGARILVHTLSTPRSSVA